MMYACRGAAAAVIVYDITSTDSYTRAKAWVRELQRQGNPNLIMALAGRMPVTHAVYAFPLAILAYAGQCGMWVHTPVALLVT